MTVERCALTGANGFVGARLKTYLERQGVVVNSWVRRPKSDGDQAFQLGQPVDAEIFRGAAALVHCAYDFSVRTWAENLAVNVAGSAQLFDAAQTAGVRKMIFISSLSSFPGCRSRYGQAKLAMEQDALGRGALVIRPGLVYGDQPGGVFGGLVRQVKTARVVPLLSGGKQPQYLVHSDDLGELIARYLRGEFSAPAAPITLAHATPWPMRQLLETIGAAVGRRPRFVSVPWRCVWLGLKTLETLRLPTPFRSDSLIGYVFQNPAPDFSGASGLGVVCRPFQLRTTMLA